MRKVRWASWLGAVAMLALLSGPAVADVASDRAAAIVEPGRAIKFTTDEPSTGISEEKPAPSGFRLALAPSATVPMFQTPVPLL